MPVWHASVMPHGRSRLPFLELRRIAYVQLAGVGDKAAGEWVERSSAGFHLRRRLSPSEVLLVGPAVDCRGTEEGKARLERFRCELPPPAIALARMELRGQ